jgi:hypothetical protein
VQDPANTYAHNTPNARAHEREAVDALATAVREAIAAGESLPPAVAAAYRTFAAATAHVRFLETSDDP